MFKEFNVLYVEDEENILKFTSNIFKSLFNKVFSQDNGEDGLNCYIEYQEQIDIIITDINMPKKNGIQMSKEIKRLNPLVPIIVTSAHNDNDFLYKAINIGINGYIIKPFEFNEVLEAIKKALEPQVLKNQLKKQEEENQQTLLKSAKFTAIGQLTAGLTHEINTPLTYIKGSVEITNILLKSMEDSVLKERLKKQYTMIDDGIDRITNIVDSMSEMAQNSSEKFEDVNIYETIIVSIIMAYNRSKHITQIYINNEPFQINIDKTKYRFLAQVQKQRVEQVWIIIINNALDELIKVEKFDNRRLDISIIENDDEVKVSFKDNAGGIKDDIFDHLFDPFKSTKESSGMGIGLSIAKKIIDEQYGNITARNEDNGAVFEVIFKKTVSRLS